MDRFLSVAAIIISAGSALATYLQYRQSKHRRTRMRLSAGTVTQRDGTQTIFYLVNVSNDGRPVTVERISFEPAHALAPGQGVSLTVAPFGGMPWSPTPSTPDAGLTPERTLGPLQSSTLSDGTSATWRIRLTANRSTCDERGQVQGIFVAHLADGRTVTSAVQGFQAMRQRATPGGRFELID